MVVRSFDRLDRGVPAPRIRVMAAGRQRQLQSFAHNGDRPLNLPVLGVHVGPKVHLGFARDHGARIARWRIHDAETVRGQHVRIPVSSLVFEVRIEGLKLPAIGRDGPGVEVIQLFVRIVLCFAMGILAALRLEDAHGKALPLNRVVLLVDRDKVLVEENHGRGVAGVCRGGRLGGVERPLRCGLLFLLCHGRGDKKNGAATRGGSKMGRAASTRRHQLPFPVGAAAGAGATVNTSCACSAASTFW